MDPNEITTDRLVLRPFGDDDVPAIARLANDPVISRFTLKIPYPYAEADARAWLRIQRREARKGTGAVFAVAAQDGGTLMGACGLEIVTEHRRGELGYWLGSDFRARGYATEAARAVMGWGFEALGLARVSAGHFSDNPASGRVLQKLGMVQEGILRRHAFRGGEFHDLVVYGILREEWEKSVP